MYQEFQFLTSFFHSNDFPFIQTKIKAFFNRKYYNELYHVSRKLYFVLPFFDNQSEKLKIELTNVKNKFCFGALFFINIDFDFLFKLMMPIDLGETLYQ